MAEEELDQLLSQMSAVADTSVESASSPVANVENRPKLKKIKRPKIRPMPITNVLPEDTSVSGESLSEDNKSIDNQIYEGDRLEKPADENTAIVTSSFAQDLVNNDAQYNLDSLPPDLDYLEGSVNDGVFIDTANYTKKSFAYMAAIFCLFIGLYVGKALFSSETVENYGLEGVVTNPDVPAGRPRCGLTDKSQACVFYLMNWYKQELEGRDFFRLAAELTGREEYMIETDNLRYANTKIKPGNIAQLNIPALK